jgi:hypothetical protein
VLDDPFANPERQVEAAVLRIAEFKVLYDPQRVQIVVETQTVPLQALIQGPFPGMAEGRMADIVYKRQRLCQVFIETERTGDAARDLHHLNGVRKTASEVVGSAAGKDLGFSGKAAKGSRLNDALAVTLKWSARGPLRGKKNPGCQLIVRILRDCTGTQVRGKDCTLAHTSSLMPAGSPQSVPLRGYLVTFAELSFANLTRAFSNLC